MLLSVEEARRVAVHAALLTAERPDDLMEVARHLTFLPTEPTAAVAASGDLVLWTRLGAGHDPADLVDALERQQLVEVDGGLRPAEDLVLYTDEMAHWPAVGEPRDWHEELREWVRANEGCRRDVLERLRQDGPLPASALPDTCERPWRSSGWNNQRNVLMLLGQLAGRGEVAVAGHEGRERLWDLAARVYPDEPPVPLEEALVERDRRRLRALGIARSRTTWTGVDSFGAGTAGEAATVEGVRGRWRVDPETLADVRSGDFRGRAALLSPFDRLVSDRKRIAELFGFDYQLEMYKPAAKRRWGYFALPVLYGDRLVGKLDARTDRAAGELVVHAVHEDEPFTRAMRDAVDAEIESLARWLDVALVRARTS